MKQTKEDIIVSLKRCITSYFPVKDDHYINNDPSTGKKKPGYVGETEDYSMFDSYEHFKGGSEEGITGISVPDAQGNKYFDVVFTGTTTDLDWALNFLAICIKTPDFEMDAKESHPDAPKLEMAPYGKKTPSGVGMHAGFLSGYLAIRDIVTERAIKAMESGIKFLRIQGHSRGAAEAQCCAVDFQKNFIERQKKLIDITSILLAPPRVFNDAGANSYNKRVPDTYRIMNATDPVCFTPPDWMGFRPVGKEIRIGFEWWTNFSVFNWLPAILEFPPLFPIQALGTAFRGLSADDHYPMHYMKNLIAYQGKIL